MATTTAGVLARRINLPLLTFYGLGTILGAGIYVLVGEVAAAAGLLAPLAFVVAAVVAGVTGLSYCQLVTCFPRSAGEAYYVEQGFSRPLLTSVVGYLVIFTGVVSAATLANGFVGYLRSFWQIPHDLGITLVVASMAMVAIWGIAESLWLAALITVVELGGLVLVVGFSGEALAALPSQWSSLFVPTGTVAVGGVLAGAFLAFYAFIGFEDMVNVVEEVKNPRQTMSRAIIAALLISTFLYALVAVVAVLGLPLSELSKSEAPLRDLLVQDYPPAGNWIAVISLFAIVNGVLTQIIMASRVLYGMADQQRAPQVFAAVWRLTRTPWLATVTVVLLIYIFALWLPLVTLAKITSFVILTVFTMVNVALWCVQRRGGIEDDMRLRCFPRIGALLCLGLMSVQMYELLG